MPERGRRCRSAAGAGNGVAWPGPGAMMGPMATNRWPDAEHALRYLAQADSIPHRTEGEATLLEFLPDRVERFVDLGWRRRAADRAGARGPPRRLGRGPRLLPDRCWPPLASGSLADDRVTVAEHDLDADAADRRAGRRRRVELRHPPPRRRPQARRSTTRSFTAPAAGRSLPQPRARGLADRAPAPGVPGRRRHRPGDDDPSNQLAPLDDQLAWLREAGFDDVDCHWKWRELALLAGVRPA